MIELYRHPVCEPCAVVEAALRSMVAAHQVITVEEGRSLPGALAGQPLPVIMDGERVFSGDAEIAAYLEGLDKELTTWRKFQMDACYVS
jgi:hypothetical protein